MDTAKYWAKLRQLHIRTEHMVAEIPMESFYELLVDGKIYEFETNGEIYIGKYESESSNFFVGGKMSYSDHEKWFYIFDCLNVKEKQ